MMIVEKKTLDVLMVATRYFPYVGGIETHIYEVGRRLVNRGINVTLLTTVPYTLSVQLPKEEVVEGMSIIRVRAWPSQRDYALTAEIFSIIERGVWDLIHCQGCHTLVPPLTILAAKKAQLPYVVTFHTGGHSSRFRSRIRGLQWKLLRPLFAGAVKLIGVSNFEATYFRTLLDLPMEQFTVIPNGVGLPILTHPSCRTVHPCLIVSIGRLERYKGHQHLITALPRISKVFPDAHLLIVGVGPYEASLRLLAQQAGVAERVEIRAIAASNRQEMAEIISQATLVTLLSEYEAHPIAVMEALALRRPVLVANTSGMSELAERGAVRAVSLNSTSDEIAAAVLYQIEEPLIPDQLTLPTWEECTEKLLTTYYLAVGGETCVS
jgi:glycosyltransferase involved in cell wall biosynthesis